jgi:hypothetical protein
VSVAGERRGARTRLVITTDERRHDQRRDGDRRRRRRREEDAGAGGLTLLAAGFLGGLVVGTAVWAGALDLTRSGLFSPNPVRRFGAVSYLATRPSVDTARLLRDYVRWEPHPLLRRRGRQALAAVEAALAR